MGTIREVRKRDGRVVPFDETKIADAIYKAIRSVGRGDRALAEELASAVTHFLEKKFAGTIPGIEDIQDQVETVLVEMGHANIAKAYILYRNKRSAVREVLQVRKPPPGESSDRSPERYVEDRGGVAPWSKGKIVAALIREADMEAVAAEEVAAAVERKVFASGIRRISTSLIRELVDNELFERGFSAKLRKQAPIGLPKYNLEQIIFGSDTKEGFTFPKSPAEVRGLIAGEILEQYALEDVHSPAVADAHREGRLCIHGLDDPIRLDRLRWNLEAVAFSAGSSSGGGSPDGGAELFDRLRHLSLFVAGEIRLVNADLLLRRGRGRADEETAWVDSFYSRLGELGFARPAAPRGYEGGPSFALEMDLDGRAVPWLQSLAVRPPGRRPALYLRLPGAGRAERSSPSAIDLAASLLERGEPIEFLPPDWSARRDQAMEGLVPAVAPVTINLPRAAFRSGRDRRRNIEREVDEAIDIAVKAHLERRRFLERLGSNPENPLWGLIGRADGSKRAPVAIAGVEFPIGIFGLNECVKFLTGFECYQDPRAVALGLDIVEAMQRKLQRESRGLGLGFVLQESRTQGALRRLEEADCRRFPEFDEIGRGRPCAGSDRLGDGGGWPCADGPRYTDGVRLYRSSPVDPLRRIEHLRAYLGLVVPFGLIEESPELRGGGAELIASLLEESAALLAKPADVRKGFVESREPAPAGSARAARDAIDGPRGVAGGRES